MNTLPTAIKKEDFTEYEKNDYLKRHHIHNSTSTFFLFK